MDIGPTTNISVIDNAITKEKILERREIKKDIKIREKIEIATKRGIDIVASIVGITLLIPITLIVAICNIVAKENGPIFFKQERIGKDGKLFKMYKYRTMVVDAEKILQRHIAERTELGKEYIKNKKIKDDPRITKIGKFLRNTSLDEFPQFINVLKGEMSLVGPRPYLPLEKEDMGDTYYIVTKMKPGLTGSWQVAGRSNLCFEDRLNLDEEYYKDKSLGKDIKILFMTFVKILKKEGAM